MADTNDTTPTRGKDLARELRETDRLASALSRFFASLTPPFGAAQRLLAKLDAGTFHESQLTLDDAGPYSFEQHVARMRTEQEQPASDLLAAGLEEQEIDDEDDDV